MQGSTDGSAWSTVVASAAYSFAPGSGNAVTINFGATSARYVRINVTANTGWPAAQVSELEVYGTATSSGNLASGRTMTASAVSQTYVAGNANDGNASTYWESANNAFPQWLQVDLGSSVSVNKVVLKLPPDTAWATRTETLTVQGSTNGSAFTTLVASAGYTFNPATGNTVTITFTATTTRYVRLNITANTGWAAGQISEFEVYGPATGDTQAPTAPANLAYAQPATGQIQLSWSASTDNVAVTGYDIYANNALLTSVGAGVLNYLDSRPDSQTVTYFVRAHDAAGNQSGNSNSVTRTGQSGDQTAPTAPGGLAYTQPSSTEIKLSWTASSDNVGVTGYTVYRNAAAAATVAGSALTWTDTQPATATVAYYVTAKDAAGNESIASNTVTRVGSGTGGANLAVGKPITGSANTWIYTPDQANDNDLTTYFEGSGYPATLTVSLGANADVTSVVVKLNPDAAWGTRTQTIAVAGREQSASSFTTLSNAAIYTFNPASGNTATIRVNARVADVRLTITTNSGAPGAQVAEFQVIGTPAPNPDLTVTAASWSPTAPVETDTITASATVRNAGTAASAASNVTFYLGTTKVGTASVNALAAGATATVSASIGTQTAGSYQLTAKVDEAGSVIETNDANNAFTATGLMVSPVQSSDLVAVTSWTPSNPSAGNTVTFSVAIKNQGTIASASGSHGITLSVLDANGSVVKTLTGSYSGVINSGATAAAVSLGTWTAVNGKYTVRVVLANDANELAVKQANNTSNQSFFVGRGANMPYDTYEAEDGSIGGGAAIVGPNRTIGDLAGEASGRRAVTLNSTGAYVQWTTKAPTNTLVVRYSIPDGATTSLNIYVNGSFLKAVPLTSKYAWLYGAETSPQNSPGSGSPRHIYDEANVLLDTFVAQGATIKLQKDAANSSQYAIDFVSLEQATAVANPDPTHYAVPAGFAQSDVQNALDRVRMDTTGTLTGVYLPAGDYQVTGKFQVYGKAVKVVGAGPWFTRFYAPTSQENSDVGFDTQSGSSGSSFSGFAWFGNYTSRQDGPGKVFNLTNLSNITIDNVWVEHQVCAIWATHVDHVTATNMRIRDTFADGINLTNGSQNNLISNNEARATGDDSFALFNAQDLNPDGRAQVGNVFQNLTAILTWRAAGLAVYGGYNNTFSNLYIADMLTYSAITISSLDFGYPFIGFGATPPTVFQNITLLRDGGHFWGAQVFPAIWCFSASKEFRGIRVTDVDIIDPTYSGIMFQTKYTGSSPENPVTDTVFTNISISGAQQSGDAYNAKSGYAIWANEMPEAGQGPTVGSVTFNHLTLTNNYINIRNTTSTFTITVNP